MFSLTTSDNIKKVLFLDETGNHSLVKIDPLYPIFALGGIIIDRQYAFSTLEDEVRQFKLRMFGRDDIILHTADITRFRNGFESLNDTAKRESFLNELNALMRKLDYKVVACVIKKEIHLQQYGLAALDPYLLSLDILAERFCFELGPNPASGIIIAEKRRPDLDRELDLAWINLKIRGTRFLTGQILDERITGLTTVAKSTNMAGLQLADLVLSPIARTILGKTAYEDYRIVVEKFRRRKPGGSYLGSGLVILPKEKTGDRKQ